MSTQTTRRPGETQSEYDLRQIIADDWRVRHEQATGEAVTSFFRVMNNGGDRARRHLAPQLAPLNTLATDALTKEAFRELRRLTNRLFDRVLMAELKDAELRVWRWVFDRTFNWNKLAERLPQDRMMNGYRDDQAEGGFRIEDGMPQSQGCGVRSPKAIVSALKSLEQRGLLDRLEQRENRHPVTFLSPLPVDCIISFLIGSALDKADKVLTPYGRSAMTDLADRIWAPWSAGQTGRESAQGRAVWQDRAGMIRPLVALPEVQSALDAFANAKGEQPNQAEPEMRQAA